MLAGLTVADPLSGSVPEPTAGLKLTLVALVLVHVRVTLLPLVIVDALAVSVAVGAGALAAVTVTVTVLDALPPFPVADTVYVVVLAGETLCVPPVAFSV